MFQSPHLGNMHRIEKSICEYLEGSQQSNSHVEGFAGAEEREAGTRVVLTDKQ